MSIYQELLAKASRGVAAVNRDNHYRRNSDGREFDQGSYHRALQGRRAQIADNMRPLINDFKKSEKSRLDEAYRVGQDDIAAERDSALQAQIAERNTLANQAQQLMATPVGAPQSVPNLAPLQDITGVALNPELTGGNAATQSFYIAPESSQSQFSVGAPVGGGGIGPRQRASTADLTSDTDTFGGGKKDQL